MLKNEKKVVIKFFIYTFAGSLFLFMLQGFHLFVFKEREASLISDLSKLMLLFFNRIL
jgi:NADH:ubiquinone oxidoreductase subunit 4 (subunit M)